MKIYTLEEYLKNPFPLDYRELTPEELKEAYALLRASFTAEDLQLFTEIEDDVPVEEVLAEMEQALREADEKIE